MGLGLWSSREHVKSSLVFFAGKGRNLIRSTGSFAGFSFFPFPHPNSRLPGGFHGYFYRLLAGERGMQEYIYKYN